jgi:hypothetical protein
LVIRNKGLHAALVLGALLLTSLLLIGPHYSGKSAAQEVSQLEDMKLKFRLSPSAIERGAGTYNLGFVQLVSNRTGEPILAGSNIEIELNSRNPGVASVPSSVTIVKGTDYAQFGITLSDIIGESEITALFGNQLITETIRVIDAGTQIPNDISLVVNLPSNEMQIGSEMPFSVFLENNGEIMQAPQDVFVTFDYDRSLVKLSSGTITIKKGDYYALATVRSLEKSGNAFIRAFSNNPSLDSVSTVLISQTQPATIKTYVFPEKVGVNEKSVDVFVGLVDATGVPTVASTDIRLELFASSLGVHNIDKADAVIKKGEFGYHLRQSIVFFSEANVTIGATAPGLGVSTDNFQIVEKALLSTSEKAQNKAVTIYTIPSGMPSDASAIVVYQLNALEDDHDDNEDSNGDGEVTPADHHPIDDLAEGELYPIQSGLLYSPNQGNLNIVTTDLTTLRVVDSGSITAGSSYGTATVSSGRQPGIVDVSVSLANTASNSGPMEITGSLTPVQTMIFSPAGIGADELYRIHFNEQGTADLFVLTLDSEGRPARSEAGVQYLLEPMNELTEIIPDSTFAGIQIRINQFDSLSEAADVSAVPIGVNADAVLQATSSFTTEFYSSITSSVLLPFESVIGSSRSHAIGTVQLTDILGNPLIASEDRVIRLSSSRAGTIPVQSVTIPMGKSFANFDVVTSGRAESLTITAAAEGVRSTTSSIASVLAELPGSFIAGTTILATQPSTFTVETSEDTSILWGVPSSFQVLSKQDNTSLDAATNTYRAMAQITGSKPGNYLIDATLLKDGYKPTRISTPIIVEAYQEPLIVSVFHNSPSVEYNEPVIMNVRVVDSESKPVPNALVRINPGPNGTAFPSEGMTDSSGILTFTYTPIGSEAMGMVTATAEKIGYSLGVKNTTFEVHNVPTIIPQWILFGVAGAGAAGAGAGVIHHMKKPKEEPPVRRSRSRKQVQEDESEAEDEEFGV